MKRPSCFAVFVLCLTPCIARDLPAAQQPNVAALNIKAITAKPTADKPQFENKEAWPMLVGDEYFTKEKWPKARLLIWDAGGATKPVKGRRGEPNGRKPENWINAATGKPAETLPDMDTDVILPDSDEPYVVVMGAMGTKNFACRHLTIGRNAHLSVEAGGNCSIFGNLWVRNGGLLTSWRNTVFTGGGDTFLRYDWPADGKLKKMHDKRLVTPFDPQAKRTDNPWMKYGRCSRSVATYMIHDKGQGKSTEVIGYVRITDEVGNGIKISEKRVHMY